MHDPYTSFDVLLPRILAGETISGKTSPRWDTADLRLLRRSDWLWFRGEVGSEACVLGGAALAGACSIRSISCLDTTHLSGFRGIPEEEDPLCSKELEHLAFCCLPSLRCCCSVPNKLPELGRAFGRTLKEFKAGARELMDDDVQSSKSPDTASRIEVSGSDAERGEAARTAIQAPAGVIQAGSLILPE